MQVITYDFETFYDRAFSLSKMTTEEYIRDELFEVIGLAVKVDDGDTQWFSGTKAQTKRWLEQFPWDDAVAVAHNAMFDAAILNWHFDIRPKMIADTLSMLRAIDGPDAGNSLAKAAERYGLGVKGTEVVNAIGKGRLDFTEEDLNRYGEYCINDVELTYDLFKALAPLIPKSEAKLIDLTIRMFSEPVLELDTDVLQTHLTDVQEKKVNLLAQVEADKADLMSNPKLAKLLEDCGVSPPRKISPTTGKPTWARLPSAGRYPSRCATTPPIPGAGVGTTRSTYRTCRASLHSSTRSRHLMATCLSTVTPRRSKRAPLRG